MPGLIFWDPDKGLLPEGDKNGVVIAGEDDFQIQVVGALDNIKVTEAGKMLLREIVALSQRTTGEHLRVSVAKADGNSCAIRTSSPKASPDDARVSLAGLYGKHRFEEFITLLKIIVNSKVPGSVGDRKSWLVSHIQQTPMYRIAGAPATGLSHFPICKSDVINWFSYVKAFPWTSEDGPYVTGVHDGSLDDLYNILMIVMNNIQGHIPGKGTHSVVMWNPDKKTIRLSTGVEQPRPPYIGLAHELIHAFYNMTGRQLSISEDPDHPSTVLYEYMCVGLGPWHDAIISENAIRGQAGVELRPAY